MILRYFFIIIFFSTSYLVSRPVLLVLESRAEAIKLYPVYEALKIYGLDVMICVTGQNQALADEVFHLCHVKPDINFNVTNSDQDIWHITQEVLAHMKTALTTVNPWLVIVQGDTTSAMIAALAAFYCKIPVAHVEAGLRTNDRYNPFPEEINRRLITTLATYHYVPTMYAGRQLIKEGISPDNIIYTGNTVVDALFMMNDKIEQEPEIINTPIKTIVETIKSDNKKLVLFTAHRRESIPDTLAIFFDQLKQLVAEHTNIKVIYPAHPNPTIQNLINEYALRTTPGITVLSPLCYTDMVYLMNEADVIATDSGGIQEEAVSLGKYILVLREKTERQEAIMFNLAKLMSNPESIADDIAKLVEQSIKHNGKRRAMQVYGTGNSRIIIAEHIKKLFDEKFSA